MELIFPTNATQGGDRTLKVEGPEVCEWPTSYFLGGFDIYLCIKVFGITESWNRFYNSGTLNEK